MGINEKVMTVGKRTSERVSQLMKEGLTLDQAIEKALEEIKPASTYTRIENRVEWVRSLENLSELRRALRSAFGKRSKGRDKQASYDKYTAEINACKARLNELLAKVNLSENPIQTAIELGEDADGVIQLFLNKKETEVTERLEKARVQNAWTNKQMKDLVSKQEPTTPVAIEQELKALGEEYLEVYNSRAKRGDQRVCTLNRKVRLIKHVELTSKPTETKAEAKPAEAKGEAKPKEQVSSKAENKPESKVNGTKKTGCQ